MRQNNMQTTRTSGVRRFAACVLLSVGAIDAVFSLRTGSVAHWFDYGLIIAGAALFISALVKTKKT